MNTTDVENYPGFKGVMGPDQQCENKQKAMNTIPVDDAVVNVEGKTIQSFNRFRRILPVCTVTPKIGMKVNKHSVEKAFLSM